MQRLVNGERERSFEKIGNFRTHGLILPHVKTREEASRLSFSNKQNNLRGL
jgi:hypothetical protein